MITSTTSSQAPPGKPLPPGSPGRRPPPRPPNRPDSLCRKRLQISSRSGGPSPRRPQFGSFNAISSLVGWSGTWPAVRGAGGASHVSCDGAAGRIGQDRAGPELVDGQAHELDSGARLRTDAKARDSTILVTLEPRSETGEIRLVEHDDLRCTGADLAQHAVDLFDLLGLRGTGRIHYVQEQIGLHRLLERRAKCRDQCGRKVSDKTHGIRQNHLAICGTVAPLGEVHAARSRVEGGEQLIGGVHALACQAVEQRRLAGIGVAHDSHGQYLRALARTALHCALARNASELVLEHFHALAEQAPVGLELRLAWAAQPDAALLPLKVGPAS